MKRFLIIVMVFISFKIFAQDVAEKIVAVVDNEIILKSDLDAAVFDEASKKNIDPTNMEIRKNLLLTMIKHKLLYAQAIADSVKISEEEVTREAEYRMQMLLQQYGSRDKLEQAANMSVEKLKKYFTDELRKRLMEDELIKSKFGRVSVNSIDVQKFYDQYKDSLGMVNEKYKISHIFVNPKSNERLEKKAKDFAYLLLDSLKKGADFAVLAKRYSADPGTASAGGDLGMKKRGELVTEYEAVAFALTPNQISDVIKTSYGYHIIQLLERKGEMVHTRHILIRPVSDDKNDLETIQFLSDLRDSIMQKKNTFEYYAKKYSDDKNSSKLGGDLGELEASQLDKQMLDQLVKMKEGDVGFPKRLNAGTDAYGFHLLKLIKKIPQHKANITTDYEDIKKLALEKKKNEMLANYIEDIKNNVYWEMRL